MENGQRPIPKARIDRLVVQELMDEVVIYDMDRHRSHCLSPTAASVWRQCDGKTSAAEMARRLRQEAGVTIDEKGVWLALSRLSRAHLLQGKLEQPELGDRASRRTLLRQMAGIGGLALVTSIVIPEAGAQATIPPACLQSSCCEQCTRNPNACKCCFAGGSVEFCSENCGNDCQQAPTNGTCFQIPNNIC